MIAYLFWDPAPWIVPYNVPLLGRPILWYGFFFALGAFLGYGILLRSLKRRIADRALVSLLAEKISLYVVCAAIVGARLGDVLFYQDWRTTLKQPLAVLRIWEGGLASHGGAAAILIALWILSKRYRVLSWHQLLDLVVVPSAVAGACIRIGNFFNQEILGVASTLPWAVLFGHPVDRSTPLPRHPVQLYEALFYVLVAGAFFKRVMRGRSVVGPFLLVTFSFRLCIECLKEEQSVWLSGAHVLTMGQYLSLPFIALGGLLTWDREHLFALHLATRWRSWREERGVKRTYYVDETLKRSDRALQRAYFWKNPYRICRTFLQEQGHTEVHQYGETPLHTLEKIGQRVHLSAQDYLIDLGCGRGRGVLFLSHRFGCHAKGVDWVPTFVETAQRIAAKHNCKRVSFVQASAHESDLLGASAIYLYGTCMEREEILTLCKRFAQLPRGVRLITVSFPLCDYDSAFQVVERFPAAFPWGDTTVYIQTT